jgi:glycosyltransferase involved in cell wall biosynthesis
MKNEIIQIRREDVFSSFQNVILKRERKSLPQVSNLPEILVITSYPPRECGIATYSQDLIKALNNKFSNSFSLKVCALESGTARYTYPDEVKYILDTDNSSRYVELAHAINDNQRIEIVLIQHEFGLFHREGEDAFLPFLYRLTKPAVIVFHTVLPHPDKSLEEKVRDITAVCASVIVMTKNAAQILEEDYGVPAHKIVVIAHGTHLVPHLSKAFLKDKYGLAGRKVLSTFGLLSSGKGIETTLDALPAIIKINPDVIFLVIGKTHPGVIKSEGEKYRNGMEEKVAALNLHHHVRFINRYLPLQDLLEYLQLTDIYLFTSNDPHQAVSGTFSYAMSCACPIISTPIPHALEVLRDDTGIIIDFDNSQHLAGAVNRLMGDEALRSSFSKGALQRIVPSAWENSAGAHGLLLQRITGQTNGPARPVHNGNSKLHPGRKISLQYRLPAVNLAHFKKITDDFGMIQFSKINQPDMDSGYTLDDNARALIAMCMHYELTGDETDLNLIGVYLNFIKFCRQPAGDFLNYVDQEHRFTAQNKETNLSDANGRAIWALGYLIAKRALFPAAFIETAEGILRQALPRLERMHSTRAMAFALKGVYYYNLQKKSPENSTLIKTLANRLVQMYRHESEHHWQWFESYLTYANSILPEAMLCAWLDAGDPVYKDVAVSSFDFLLGQTFNENGIEVISNKNWLLKGQEAGPPGEQPIDVAYTISALSRFYDVFRREDYRQKMETAFNWFLGENRLHQIIYNPCTGGCYDGLEEMHVNLNQGAESTVSYLIARLTMEKYKNGS